MKKAKSVWYCAECGNKQSKWSGQCSQCEVWNTLHEEVEVSEKQMKFESQVREPARPVRLKEVAHKETPRIQTGIGEFDRLLGGGVVRGSLTLVGGEPGIGKSTLLLQISEALANQGLVVLYVCGEESVEQTSLRARRLSIESDNLLLLSETNYSHIRNQVEQLNPDILIVDSIQIMYKSELQSAPGSVSQVRETTSEFMHLAKGKNVSVFLVGHVTKSGEIAGPKILEHLVDTVLYFEGDKQHQYRMVRVVKNRFGATDEIAVFQMFASGLSEVRNPSQIFLEERQKEVFGSVILPALEGSRPILVEVQALVTKTVFSTPSRRCAGIDQNRLALLLAVLEKRIGVPMYQFDVFISVAGGLRILEPAVDLAVITSIASSLKNRTIDYGTTVMGEVGLAGEIRGIPRTGARVKEAIQMGFKRCMLPKYNLSSVSAEYGKSIELVPVEFVDEAVKKLVG